MIAWTLGAKRGCMRRIDRSFVEAKPELSTR
jgi:hypothetical protein